MRVTLNGTRPEGNTVVGSRASGKYPWHFRHRLTAQFNPADGQMWWYRTTGDDPETDENDIGPGHIQLGDDP